jgi:hypothetical protein
LAKQGRPPGAGKKEKNSLTKQLNSNNTAECLRTMSKDANQEIQLVKNHG